MATVFIGTWGGRQSDDPTQTRGALRSLVEAWDVTRGTLDCDEPGWIISDAGADASAAHLAFARFAEAACVRRQGMSDSHWTAMAVAIADHDTVGIEPGMTLQSVQERGSGAICVAWRRMSSTSSAQSAVVTNPGEPLASNETSDRLLWALTSAWAKAFGVPNIDPDDDFFQLGGDSLLSIQICTIAQGLGVNVTSAAIAEHRTVRSLADSIRTRVSSTSMRRAVSDELTADYPLTPAQAAFVESDPNWLNMFNTGSLRTVKARLPRDYWESIANRLFAVHPALRLRFYIQRGEWRQRIIANDSVPFYWIDLSGLASSRQSLEVRTQWKRLERNVNITEGPLAQFAYFDRGPRLDGLLLTVAHHLASDRVSAGILRNEIETACSSFIGGTGAAIGSEPTSYCEWLDHLVQYARSDAVLAECDYWCAGRRLAPTIVPRDNSCGDNTEGSVERMLRRLSASESQKVLKSGNRTVSARGILLAALGLTMYRWTRQKPIVIAMIDHGRRSVGYHVDTSRTVGLLSTGFPFAIDIDETAPLAGHAQRVETEIRQVPNGGLGFGLLAYLNPGMVGDDSHRLRQVIHASEISFNYVGHLPSESAVIGPAPQIARPRSIHPRRRRSLVLSFSVWVDGKRRIVLGCDYSRNIHKASTIENVMDLLVDHVIATSASLHS